MSKEENSRFAWPIIGHGNIINYLQRNLETGQISHAYLFVGPDHVGKTAMAENMVNSLVCENLAKNSGSIPCHQCESCKQANNEIHPDIYWVEREIDEKSDKLKKNISIEQIRELQNKLNLRSFLNSYKVAVINQASSLSSEAANSLLKTLEEPSPKTVIILLAANIAALPRTVVSRCQVIKFLPVGIEDIFNHLRDLKTERKKAKTLASLSFGRPGMAINYLTQPDYYFDFQDQIKQFVALMKTDINNRFKIINDLARSNDINGIKEILIVWSKILRDLVLIKYSAESLVSNINLLPTLQQTASTFPAKDLIKFLAEVNLAKRYLDANVNPKLTLENLVLNF